MSIDLWQVTIAGLLAGVIGTGLGGFIIAVWGRPSKRILSFVLGFSGGIMLAIIFIDLLPEGLSIGGTTSTFAGLLAGVALLALLDFLVPHAHASGEEEQRSHFVRVSILLGLGIAMHNLPEGLAIGTGYAVSSLTGWRLMVTMMIQNIPEGMAMAGPMVAAEVPCPKCVAITAIAGIPMGLGAFLGGIIGTVSPLTLAMSLGFAAGAMLYIVFDELIPEAQLHAEGHSGTFGAVMGVLIGMAILSYLG
jgi:ZIP family zinc transporter